VSRLRALAIVLIVFLGLPLPAALGQEAGEPPASGEETCKAGELCDSGEVEEPFGESTQEVLDPPGRYVRSLLTLGLIGAFVGSYLFMALTGKTPRFRLSRRGS
jgi:hypothetical protein